MNTRIILLSFSLYATGSLDGATVTNSAVGKDGATVTLGATQAQSWWENSANGPGFSFNDNAWKWDSVLLRPIPACF
jgi:hypothetical protein